MSTLPTTHTMASDAPTTTAGGRSGRKRRRGILAAGLLGGAALGSGVALTGTSGWLIVRASERPVILTLLTAVVAVRTFGIARPVFRYWERLRSHDASLADLADRRTSTYAALIPLTPARLGRRSRGDLLGRVVDDVTEAVEAQVRVTVPLISALVAGLIGVALTAVLLPVAAVPVAGLLVTLALCVWVAYLLERRSQRDLVAARADVSRLSELVAAEAGAIQAVAGGYAVLARLGEADRLLGRAVRRQSSGRALVAGSLPVLVAATTVAVAWLAVGASVRPAILALLVLVPVGLGEVLGGLVTVAGAKARAVSCEERLTELLEVAPAVTEGPELSLVGCTSSAPPAVPHLRLEAVRAAWAPGAAEVGPWTLDLRPGSHLLVTGPNGVGKSTLLAVLARHLDPVAGSCWWDGVEVRRLGVERVREQVAIVDDEPHVFASTLRENLRLAAPAADDSALSAALGAAGLGGWLAGLPSGLDTVLGSGGRGVSGGERARLAVARALLSERPVLLLDEPVAHLDHPTARAVLHDLFTAARGRTVVVVSHQADAALLDGLPVSRVDLGSHGEVRGLAGMPEPVPAEVG